MAELPTHTTLRTLLARYGGWSVTPVPVGCQSCGSDEVASDDEALDMLHQWAAATGVLDNRPSVLVDELADELHNEWPGLLNDGLQQSVARTVLRLLVGVELPLLDDEKPSEPRQWGAIISASRSGVPGFFDVPRCRWQRDAEGYWRAEYNDHGVYAVAQYSQLTGVEILSRGPE